MYDKYFLNFDFNECIDYAESIIKQIEKRFNLKLPDDYIEFMMKSNGGEGNIGKSYIILYPLQDIIDTNEGCEVEEFTPGILVIGGDGGSEAFALDYRTDNIEYVMIPFLFEYEAIIKQSNSLEGFFERAYNDKLFN